MFFNVILSPGPSKPDGRQIRSGPVCYLEQSACQHVRIHLNRWGFPVRQPERTFQKAPADRTKLKQFPIKITDWSFQETRSVVVDYQQAIAGASRQPSLLGSTSCCPPFPGYSVGIINELPRVSFQNGRFRQRLTVFFILPGQQTNGRLYLLIFDKTHG
jgi:hypothetical protein